jgi:hypothetical protein
LSFQVGPPAGPGSVQARSRARSCWGTCRASIDPWALAGPGRDRTRLRLVLGGFPRQAGGGGCGASRLRDAGLCRVCPHCLHRLGSLPCLVCLRCVSAGSSRRYFTSRATPGAGRAGALLRRRRCAARWEPCGAAGALHRLRRVSALRLLRAGQGQSPGRRLHPSSSPAGAALRQGVNKLSHGCSGPSLFKFPTRT